MPKVSILIPSYNHDRYVSDAIRSVLIQTFQDFEIVITDDGSADASVVEIQKVKDPRITLFTFKENRGAVAAIELSRSFVGRICRPPQLGRSILAIQT